MRTFHERGFQLIPTGSEGPSPLERAFEAHHAAAYRAAYRVTGNAADAEDALQTVFLRLLGCQEEGKLGAGYLVRAAVNAALDILRSRGLRLATPLEEAGPIASRTSAPDADQQAREERRFLRRALAELPPQLAEVFVLRHVEGLPPREIAATSGSSPAVVAVQLFRAKARLRLLMAEMAPRGATPA